MHAVPDGVPEWPEEFKVSKNDKKTNKLSNSDDTFLSEYATFK